MGPAVTTTYRAADLPYPEDAPVSQALFDRAQAIVPGGVNSPVRAFRAVGGTPRFMVSGSGPWMTDADGRASATVGGLSPFRGSSIGRATGC